MEVNYGSGMKLEKPGCPKCEGELLLEELRSGIPFACPHCSQKITIHFSSPSHRPIVSAFERMTDAGVLVLGYIALFAVPTTALLILAWGALKLWRWLA